MDWKRIKTILVFALIAINLILGYVLYEENKIENNTLAISREHIVDLIVQKNIVIPDNIFDVKFEISNLKVKLSNYDLDNMSAVFSQYLTDDITNPKTEIVGKKLTYTTKYEVLKPTVLEDDEIIEMAYKLITDLGFSKEDIFLLPTIGRTGKKTILYFGQIVNGSVIVDSEMMISFNNENLIEFRRLWYDIVSISETDKTFYSPEYALYRFLGQEYDRYPNRRRDVIVQSLNLVYKLTSDMEGNISRNPVVEGEASIYWEIKTSNDTVSYLVDAIKD